MIRTDITGSVSEVECRLGPLEVRAAYDVCLLGPAVVRRLLALSWALLQHLSVYSACYFTKTGPNLL